MRYIRRFLRLYQGFVLSGAILFFGTIAGVLAVIPGVRATVDLYGSVGELGKETEVLSGKLSFLQATNEETLRGQLLTLLSAIPQGKSVQTIFSTVEGLAVRSGVAIVDVTINNPGSLATGSAAKVSASGKAMGVSLLPFSVTTSGTYNQIREFFGSINQVRRLFDVENFDLSLSPDGATQARLSLNAYYQPLGANIGGIQTPLLPLTQREEEIVARLSNYTDVSASFLQETLSPIIGGKSDPFAR